jgi:hypothetical protein
MKKLVLILFVTLMLTGCLSNPFVKEYGIFLTPNNLSYSGEVLNLKNDWVTLKINDGKTATINLSYIREFMIMNEAEYSSRLKELQAQIKQMQQQKVIANDNNKLESQNNSKLGK